MTDQNSIQYLVLAGDIVSAFVSNNSVPAAELPALIGSVHAALRHTAEPSMVEAPVAPQEPAVSIKKSVGTDFIICLEDGKKFKSLKRHLASKYGLTPDQYRAKWKLPSDYPMVAPAYAAQRSELAKKIGLGSQRAAAKSVATPAVKSAKRSTKKAA